MLFKISHSVCPCISFQTLTHTEEPFLRYSITLTVTIFWAGCKKKSAELLHHLLMVHVLTKWTLISQFPGQSLDPIPLDRVFLAAEVNHSPRHQRPPILQGWNLGVQRSGLKNYCKKIKTYWTPASKKTPNLSGEDSMWEWRLFWQVVACDKAKVLLLVQLVCCSRHCPLQNCSLPATNNCKIYFMWCCCVHFKSGTCFCSLLKSITMLIKLSKVWYSISPIFTLLQSFFYFGVFTGCPAVKLPPLSLQKSSWKMPLCIWYLVTTIIITLETS